MDKKSLLIGALSASLMFVTLGAGTSSSIQNATPESHVQEFHLSDGNSTTGGMAFSINKRTGEVRKFNSNSKNTEICTLILTVYVRQIKNIVKKV